ncbi:MAG: FAD-binding oxidoreductase, partial [Pseudomonadota bacterium]
EGEYVVAEHPTHSADLIAAADAAERVLGHRPEVLSREAFRERGYDAPHQHGALLEAPSFGLHPLRYVYGLAGAAERHGAHLHPASEVISWEKEGNAHVLRTRDGSVRARHVIVTGNGFLAEHLAPQLAGRVLPLQSVIVVTRPLSDDELERHPWTTGNPAINARNVYCYYRLLPDRRLMIGGRGDFTGRADRLDATRQYLKGEIARLWPGWADVDIAYCWRGLVCFSSRLAPTVGRFQDDPSVSFSFAYHGNGVNNATWCGRALAQWLAGGNDPTATVPHHLPAMVRGFAPRLPFPGLRRSYARAGVAVHRLLDWRDDRREARRARRARMSA